MSVFLLSFKYQPKCRIRSLGRLPVGLGSSHKISVTNSLSSLLRQGGNGVNIMDDSLLSVSCWQCTYPKLTARRCFARSICAMLTCSLLLVDQLVRPRDWNGCRHCCMSEVHMAASLRLSQRSCPRTMLARSLGLDVTPTVPGASAS